MSPDIISTVRRFLLDHAVTNSTVVVAVSGGVDSMSLLDLITTLAPRMGLTVTVAHANHGLRGTEADDDQRLVTSISELYGFECITENLNVLHHAQKTGKGIEASARDLRYTFLTRAAVAVNAKHVLVGHTADDAAETLLAHIARGSGIDGLTSHSPSRSLTDSVRLLRPMLAIERTAIVEYAMRRGLQWREDSSNADLNFLRNNIRHEVMPAMRKVFGPQVAQRMARSAALLRDVRSVVQASMAKHHHHVRTTTQGSWVPVDYLRTLLPAEQQELLRFTIQQQTHGVVTYVDTMRVLNLLHANVGSRATLQGNVEAWRERDEIYLLSTNNTDYRPITITEDGTYSAGDQQIIVQATPNINVAVTADPMVAFIDSACIEGPLQWRIWTDGERFVPFGSQQTTLVSDMLTNYHVPSSQRRAIRVVSDDLGILWVCGLRQAERTRITSSTEHITILRQL